MKTAQRTNGCTNDNGGRPLVKLECQNHGLNSKLFLASSSTESEACVGFHEHHSHLGSLFSWVHCNAMGISELIYLELGSASVGIQRH